MALAVSLLKFIATVIHGQTIWLFDDPLTLLIKYQQTKLINTGPFRVSVKWKAKRNRVHDVITS